MKRGRALIAAAVLMLASTAAAEGPRGGTADAPSEAAAPRPVLLVLPECVEEPLRGELLAALRVELHETTGDVAEGGPRPENAIVVSLGPSCDPSRLALRVLLDPASPLATAERVVDVERVPDASRARVVAIALAELVRSAIDDPQQGRRAAAPPPGIAATEATPPRAAEPAESWVRGLVGGQARASFDGPTLHGGPRGDLRLGVTPWLDVAVGVTVLFAGETTPLGDTAAVAGVGRAAASVAHREPSIQLDAGLFGEIGLATLDATASGPEVTARDARGLAAAIGITGGAELIAASPLRVRAEIESGIAVASVEGEAGGEVTPGYGGAFFGLGLLLGLAL